MCDNMRRFKPTAPGGYRGLMLATLLKKSFWQRCFPMNFAKFLRTTFFREHLQCLHLTYYSPSVVSLCLIQYQANIIIIRYCSLNITDSVYFKSKLTCTSSTYRSSHRWCSRKKVIVKNFAKFIRKHLCRRCCFKKNQFCFEAIFENPSFMQHIDVKKHLDFVNKPIELLITETELKFPIPLKKAGNTAYADIILACYLSSHRLYQPFDFFFFDFKFFTTKESF